MARCGAGEALMYRSGRSRRRVGVLIGMALAVSAQMGCGDAEDDLSGNVVRDIEVTTTAPRTSSSTTTTEVEREVTTTTATATTSPPATTMPTTSPPVTTMRPPEGLTLAKYEQLYLGMPEAEVWAIVTAPCRLDGETQIPPIEVNGEVAYEGLIGKQYMCETGSGFAVIGIQNGKVSFLSQYGLR